MIRLPTALLALVMALATAGCGELPRPFRGDKTAGLDLRQFYDANQVVVAAEPGMSGGAALAEALAAELRGVRIAAMTSEVAMPVRRLTLASREEGDLYVLDWQLTEPGGRVIAGGSAGAEASPPSGATLDALVQMAGAELAPHFGVAPQLAAVGPAAGPAVPTRLVVLPIPGLPGDGSASLPPALKTFLQAGGRYPIAEEIDSNDLLIQGDMIVSQVEPGWQDVSFVWYVIRASDGAELGQISQDNRIPSGSLNDQWGVTADAIAQGAALGINDLLDRFGPREGNR